MLEQAVVNILTNHSYSLPIKELLFFVLLPLRLILMCDWLMQIVAVLMVFYH